jgi:hypothetical protein
MENEPRDESKDPKDPKDNEACKMKTAKNEFKKETNLMKQNVFSNLKKRLIPEKTLFNSNCQLIAETIAIADPFRLNIYLDNRNKDLNINKNALLHMDQWELKTKTAIIKELLFTTRNSLMKRIMNALGIRGSLHTKSIMFTFKDPIFNIVMSVTECFLHYETNLAWVALVHLLARKENRVMTMRRFRCLQVIYEHGGMLIRTDKNDCSSYTSCVPPWIYPKLRNLVGDEFVRDASTMNQWGLSPSDMWLYYILVSSESSKKTCNVYSLLYDWTLFDDLHKRSCKNRNHIALFLFEKFNSPLFDDANQKWDFNQYLHDDYPMKVKLLLASTILSIPRMHLNMSLEKKLCKWALGNGHEKDYQSVLDDMFENFKQRSIVVSSLGDTLKFSKHPKDLRKFTYSMKMLHYLKCENVTLVDQDSLFALKNLYLNICLTTLSNPMIPDDYLLLKSVFSIMKKSIRRCEKFSDEILGILIQIIIPCFKRECQLIDHIVEVIDTVRLESIQKIVTRPKYFKSMRSVVKIDTEMLSLIMTFMAAKTIFTHSSKKKKILLFPDQNILKQILVNMDDKDTCHNIELKQSKIHPDKNVKEFRRTHMFVIVAYMCFFDDAYKSYQTMFSCVPKNKFRTFSTIDKEQQFSIVQLCIRILRHKLTELEVNTLKKRWFTRFLAFKNYINMTISLTSLFQTNPTVIESIIGAKRKLIALSKEGVVFKEDNEHEKEALEAMLEIQFSNFGFSTRWADANTHLQQLFFLHLTNQCFHRQLDQHNNLLEIKAANDANEKQIEVAQRKSLNVEDTLNWKIENLTKQNECLKEKLSIMKKKNDLFLFEIESSKSLVKEIRSTKKSMRSIKKKNDMLVKNVNDSQLQLRILETQNERLHMQNEKLKMEKEVINSQLLENSKEFKRKRSEWENVKAKMNEKMLSMVFMPTKDNPDDGNSKSSTDFKDPDFKDPDARLITKKERVTTDIPFSRCLMIARKKNEKQ